MTCVSAVGSRAPSQGSGPVAVPVAVWIRHLGDPVRHAGKQRLDKASPSEKQLDVVAILVSPALTLPISIPADDSFAITHSPSFEYSVAA